MKKVIYLGLVLSTFALGACRKESGDTYGSNQATTPQSVCGNQIPNEYCAQGYGNGYYPTDYTYQGGFNCYGYYIYGSNPYSNYCNSNPYRSNWYPYQNNGYQNYWYQPYNYSMSYGCPMGTQPVYTGIWGTNFTCVYVSAFQSWYQSTNYRFRPYYPTAAANTCNGSRPCQRSYEPLQACNVGQNNCGGASHCQAMWNSNYGVCVR